MHYISRLVLIAILNTQGIIQTSGDEWKENRTTVLSILRDFGMGKNVMAEKIEDEVRLSVLVPKLELRYYATNFATLKHKEYDGPSSLTT